MTFTAAELTGRARRLTYALWVMAVAAAALAVTEIALLVGKEERLGGPPGDGFLLVVGYSMLFVTTALLWLHWFQTLYLPVALHGLARFDANVWWWVIPLVDLVIPKKMVNDVWWLGDRRRPRPWQVQVWWVCWLLAAPHHLTGRGEEELPAWVSPARTVLLMVSAVLAVHVVRLLTDRVLPAGMHPSVDEVA